MAQKDNNQTGQKRGPGRPPGSKNKPKDTKAASTAAAKTAPTKKEVIDEMQRRSDRDRRNLDVIWSITLFAVGLFLFFTVVMDSTGSFGMKVHDLCLGLFGTMAFVLPFLVFVFASLLMAGKLQHIGARTSICSILIFLNICILNSYRYIDPTNLRYGFSDIVDYYIEGIEGKSGGVFGMEIGSILAKFFGMPGLLIIAISVLIISIFLVANTPISRFFEGVGNKSRARRFAKELEAEELASRPVEPAMPATTGRTVVSAPAESAANESGKGSFWKSILNGIMRDDEIEEVPAKSSPSNPSAATDIPRPLGVLDDKDIDYTQVVQSPLDMHKEAGARGTLFGRIKGYFAGIDSQTGVKYTESALKAETEAAGQKSRVIKGNSGTVGMDGVKSSERSIYAEDRDFERDEEDYGYKRRTDPNKTSVKKGYGLGDPEDVGHSGAYGLDAHGKSGSGRRPSGESAGTGLGAGAAAGAAATKAKTNKPVANKEDEKKAVSDNKAAKTEEAPQNYDDLTADKMFGNTSDDIGYEFPPVSLLKKDTSSKQLMNDAQLEERAELLEKTLNDFGVDAKVLTVTQGASVTRYEVQPATGVKVASITRLADDIALNLRAKSIRMEAPIPGKAAVGIEVENDKPAPVLIRDLIDSEEFMDAPSIIEFVVGKDISGNNIVADLKDMPHLLIAGATGSGKSVCINSIITSFLYKARPSELKLIMIDPKVVELGNYNGIPHMMTPVVTDPRKAARALAIAVEEMDKRYEAFATHNVKDLESYNELMRADQRYADCKPQIVIIIDELADLMMAAPSEVENSICRLAQKARAAGMHLIVATQRPSVDVVTGLIKANIPSRIAFSVASQFDSRTILDMAGAEKLLGKGDMLFSPVGSTKPYRVQGPFISEKETEKIIKFVKKEGGSPEYDEELKNAIENADKKSTSEAQDELTEDAIAFIFKSKQASVSMLQRRFRIGYNRAARIIDEIEEKGIIGPSDGSRPRQLLMTEEEYYGGYSDGDNTNGISGSEGSEEAPEVVQESEVSGGYSVEPEPAPDEAFGGADKLSNTQAMNSFNSLPESVRRAVMDADSEDNY